MSQVYTPVVDADALYGEGNWRPLLGDGPREDDWKLYFLGKNSIEHRLRGIFLPSFDFTMGLHDQAFLKSIASCWSSTPDKRLPRHFTPNAFAIPLLVYTYMGERKEHWFSPANLRSMIGGDTIDPAETADAFDDLNRYVRTNSKFSKQEKEFFLKAERLKDDAPVPGRQVRYFALCECADKENGWHKAVVGFTATAYSYLIEQMRWRHEDACAPRDPAWPQYLLGDPTNPAQALEWHPDKVQLDPKDSQETNVMAFTERREFLDTDQRVRKASQDAIDKRFLLPDPTNWNIPTYEEQVEHMLNTYDPSVTIDMIRAAVGARFRGELPHSRPEHITAAVGRKASDEQPERSSDRTSRQDTSAAADPMAAVTAGSMAPRSSAPPSPNLPPAAAQPAAPAVSYWSGPTGGTPVKRTPAELQQLVDAGTHAGIKVCMDGATDWRPIETCGLVTLPPPPPAAEAPPVIPSDAPPMVPADVPPVVPSQPAASTQPAAAAPAASGGITKEQLKLKLFPDPAATAALDQAKVDDIVERAWKGTDAGTKTDLPSDVIADWMNLVSV